MAKPVVVGTLFEEFPPLVTSLKAKFDYHPMPKGLKEKEAFLAEKRASIRAVVTDVSNKVNDEFCSNLPSLEIVSTFGVGVDFVDLQCCKRRGLVVTNTADVVTAQVTADVADIALALVLATMRKICDADRLVRAGEWNQVYPLTTQVSGKRVGVVGLGQIGAAIAKRAAAFDCTIGYWSRAEKKGVPYKYFGSITELARHSDVLILACALAEETTRIINREVLDALGPEGYLVNIARGLVVDQAELVRALLEGRIAGAGLDVYEKEPHVPEELFKLDNVVLLPHLGSGTVDTRQAMANLVVANLEAHFSGKPVLTPVSL